ncbi:phage head morphogenesis protein [Gordonia sp. HY285]|uniref:phage minor head protein n=1 Tax=Gordonia liuliyuniae TaxID=2911517 RepID=UPI001F1D2AF6|nr:phage minor head protein [Gordonia liuliyuniae]MCF8610052.1 phage head morphogenesis protein [Gordonia liuliyuniae]
MPSLSAELLREAADRKLAVVEAAVEAAVLRAMRDWLQAVGYLVIREVMDQRGITAAGYPTSPDAAVDAATAAYNDWRRSVDNNVLPAVSIAFGEGFQQVRRANRGTGSFAAQQEHMERVADRLRIWPEGAFEKLRPELVEALAEAETIEQVKDRVGRVLEIDSDSRETKARINEVEAQLADPTVEGDDRRELRALRRQLWDEHDAELSDWEWKARRIARTEAHGAVNAGQIASARQIEADTGETWYKRWLATDDPRTRVTHRVADGQLVPISGKFRVGGFLLDFPGDPIVVAPHEVINCRCTMLVHDPDAVQDELQGPDASNGAVEPGGVRLGTDDPDEAARVIVETAEAEHRELPPDVEARGEHHGQAPPPDTADVALTDERDAPVYREPEAADIDLRGYTDDELLKMMVDTADDLDGRYEAARDEYDRRTLLPDDREEPRDTGPDAVGDDSYIDDDILGGPDDADADELTQYLDELNADFVVSRAEQSAVYRWQGMDRFYQRVQALEREDGPDDDEADDVRDLLDDLIARNPLPRPVLVWRGVRNLEAMFGDAARNLASLIGESIPLAGFTAASTSPEVATSFTIPGKLKGLLRVAVRAGMGHLWVAGAGDPALAEQRELLLRASEIVILGVTDGAVPVIDVEVR